MRKLYVFILTLLAVWGFAAEEMRAQGATVPAEMTIENGALKIGIPMVGASKGDLTNATDWILTIK